MTAVSLLLGSNAVCVVMSSFDVGRDAVKIDLSNCRETNGGDLPLLGLTHKRDPLADINRQRGPNRWNDLLESSRQFRILGEDANRRRKLWCVWGSSVVVLHRIDLLHCEHLLSENWNQ